MTRPPRRGWFGATALLVMFAALAAIPTLAQPNDTAEPAAVRTKLAATEDASVSARRPNANSGNKTLLATKVDPEEVSFIKFEVPAGNGEIASALLKMKVKTRDKARVTVSAAGNGWNEMSVTHRTAPPVHQTLVTVDIPSGQPRWVSVDVSSLVTVPGVYSVAVQTQSNKRPNYYSSETSSGPASRATCLAR